MQLSKQEILDACEAMTSTKILDLIERCIENERESCTYQLVNGENDLAFYIREKTRAQMLDRVTALIRDFREVLDGPDIGKLDFMSLINVTIPAEREVV